MIQLLSSRLNLIANRIFVSDPAAVKHPKPVRHAPESRVTLSRAASSPTTAPTPSTSQKAAAGNPDLDELLEFSSLFEGQDFEWAKKGFQALMESQDEAIAKRKFVAFPPFHFGCSPNFRLHKERSKRRAEHPYKDSDRSFKSLYEDGLRRYEGMKQEYKALKTSYDHLEAVKQALEASNKDLKSTIHRLSTEITDMRARPLRINDARKLCAPETSGSSHIVNNHETDLALPHV